MPIGRCPKPSLLRRIDPLGQPARTRYRLLEQGPAWSLLGWSPHRPDPSAAGPLRLPGLPHAGRPQYGTTASQALSTRLGLSYQQLCARELHFPHPMTGVEVSIQSGLGVKLADVPPNLNAAYEKKRYAPSFEAAYRNLVHVRVVFPTDATYSTSLPEPPRPGLDSPAEGKTSGLRWGKTPVSSEITRALSYRSPRYASRAFKGVVL